jgi:glutathione peroxidase
MNNKNIVSGLIFLSSLVPLAAESEIFNIKVEDIDGNERTLETHKGKVMLIVNVASKCGFTYQYESLEAVYQKYKDEGLVIIGFPSNDFLGQEPGTDEEIKQFCTLTYGVTFPMFSKVTVKGRQMHPLYRFLTSKETNPDFSGRITWNFNKFLVSRKGEIVNRFGSKDEPDSMEITNAIEEALVND